MSDRAKALCERYEKLVNARAILDDHCQEIAERILPRQSTAFFTPQRNRLKYERRTEQMVDATGAIALERFAAVMESMLTPMHQKWHRLRASDPAINRDREAQLWFEEVNWRLWDERKRSTANFQSQQFEAYIGLGAFGTGAQWIDSHEDGGLRYRAIHLSEVVYDVNHQGIIDTAMRKFVMTARQLKQKMDAGRFEELPDDVMRALEKEPDKEYDVLHVVMPRSDRMFGRLDFQGMPFASYYILMDQKFELSEGGFNTFPYAISRYVTAPGETYGRSPAMTALPSINTLNEQKKTVLKQGHRATDPVILTFDDGVLDTLSLKPGAINAGGVSAEGRRLVDTLPVGNPMVGVEMMEMEKQVINDVFLVSVFNILLDRRGQTPPTATEVLELAKEKGSLLAPTMGRQQSEMLGPMIERELDLLASQDLLPEPPPIIVEAGGEFEIEYESPLSRAQRAEEAAGLFRTIELATTLANVTQDPSAFDWIDIDKAMPAVMEINGVPASWQRSLEEVQQARQGRNVQQETQQLIDAAPAAAGLLKAVGG